MGLRRTLASQSGVVFAARMAGAGLTFLVQAAIARAWGAPLLGDYLVAIAATNLVAVFLPLGFQTAATFLAADYVARGDGASLRRFAGRAWGHIALPGFVVLGVVYLAAGLMGEPGARLQALWAPIALLAAGTATVYVNGALLVGLGRPYLAFFADTLIRPALAMAAFVGIATLDADATDRTATLLWYVGGGYALLALGHAGLAIGALRRVPGTASSQQPASDETRRWWRLSLPLTALALANDVFFDLDLLMLAVFLEPEAIAVFGVCTRVFVLVAFGTTAVYTMALPALLARDAAGDAAGLSDRIGDVNAVAVGLALILLGAIAIGAPALTLLFGPEFAAARTPLVILCASLVVRALFGPAFFVLAARDRAAANLPAVALGLVVLVALNAAFVPAYGLDGAALAAFGALCASSAALWWTVRRLTGLDVSILPVLRTRTSRRAFAP